MNEKFENFKTEFNKLFKGFDTSKLYETAFKPLEEYIRSHAPECISKETKVENVKKMLEGKTIAKAEFSAGGTE